LAQNQDNVSDWSYMWQLLFQ